MSTRTAAFAGACTAALVLASGAAAMAAPGDHGHKPDKTTKSNHAHAPKVHKGEVGVTKLQIINVKKQRDVATEDAVVRAHVQVKDRSKAFTPDQVTLKVVDSTGADTTMAVDAVRKGRSKVVTNWHASFTVAAGSVAPGATATYCIKVVKVSDGTDLLDTTKAKGLKGRDCVTVVNSTPA